MLTKVNSAEPDVSNSRGLNCTYLRGFSGREILLAGVTCFLFLLVAWLSEQDMAAIAFGCLMIALWPSYLLLAWAKRYAFQVNSFRLFLLLLLLLAGVTAAVATLLFYRWALPSVSLLLVDWQGFLIALSLPLLLSWSAVWTGLQLQRRFATRQREEEKKELERAVLLAELKALQAQVEPHFLFNTLANLMHLIEHDSTTARKMLEHLVAYLRASLPSFRNQMSELGQELELVRNYLALIAMRFGARFQFQVEASGNSGDWRMPPMMLISLVENAVKHGVERKSGPVEIRVRAECTPQQIVLTVTDTGAGLQPNANGNGVGLRNIRERLQRLYGDSAELTLQGNEAGGVTAALRLPKTNGHG